MIINMNGGGGGKTGATLVVNSSGSGVVTVNNAELGKSYSKAVTMGGSVEFKGLATGTWTVTLSNDIQSTTQSVNVTADYSVAIAYFAATINITYPEGSICTATDGVSTFTAPDTSGTWALIVPNVGDWTITITDPAGGNAPQSETVTINADGQAENVELSYTTYLFNYGRQEMQWAAKGWKYSSATSEYSLKAPSVKTNADGSVTITFSITANTWGQGAYHMKTDFDFTSFNTLYAEYDYEENHSGDAAQLCILDRDSTYMSSNVTSKNFATGTNKTLQVDISKVNGLYDLAIAFYRNGYTAAGVGTDTLNLKTISLAK